MRERKKKFDVWNDIHDYLNTFQSKLRKKKKKKKKDFE